MFKFPFGTWNIIFKVAFELQYCTCKYKRSFRIMSMFFKWVWSGNVSCRSFHHCKRSNWPNIAFVRLFFFCANPLLSASMSEYWPLWRMVNCNILWKHFNHNHIIYHLYFPNWDNKPSSALLYFWSSWDILPGKLGIR